MGELAVAHARTSRGAVVVAAVGALLALAAPTAPAAPAAGTAALRVQAPAERVALLTGPGSMNRTDLLWQVKGTDLGIPWATESGQVLVAFGDTFGLGWTAPGTHNLIDMLDDDWRSNVLARSRDANLGDGMVLDDFVVDVPLHARELLPSKKIDNDEITVIPTGGINVSGRDYLAYMSVRHWGAAGGTWLTNHAGIAYSDDNGRTWIDVPGARRPNTPAFDDGFQLVSYARRDGFVYAYGTPNGRFGDARLARVPETAVLDPAAYRYWTGRDWQPDAARAAVVVPGPVGEMSVLYHEDLRRWLMTYLDESRHEIVLRTADAPSGPWSEEQPIAGAENYPQLYGAFMHPMSSGEDVYFTMSEFGPYNVSLMRVRLTRG